MTGGLPNVIRNEWHRAAGEPFAISRILSNGVHPEGLDVDRVRFLEAASLALNTDVGHIVSVIRGRLALRCHGESGRALHLATAAHFFVPPRWEVEIDAEAGTELLRVSSASASQARGERLLVRDEEFLAACATESQSLRWVLTSQYLSRRIFLHSDATLLSRSGNPVSWYRTTMFDVAGLPPNDDGEPVFKMAYNSRTEFNVCCEVEGLARVRMALHPYQTVGQAWGPWFPIDGDSTYHLNEASGSTEEERWVNHVTGAVRTARNKHEVCISDGHVTLYCLFDPAPTGIESHRPGQYSDYELVSTVLGTEQYEAYLRELAKYDEMVDQLSLAKARGELGTFGATPIWQVYVQGSQARAARETALIEALAAEGHGRDRVVARWTKVAG